MKKIALGLIILFASEFCLAQPDDAKIMVNEFKVMDDGGRFYFDCTIEYLKDINYQKDYLLVFFIKYGDSSLQLISISDKNKRVYPLLKEKYLNTYSISLVPNKPSPNNFSVYPVVLEGDESSIKKILPAAEDKSLDIKQLLNSLKSKNCKPLTYISITR